MSNDVMHACLNAIIFHSVTHEFQNKTNTFFKMQEIKGSVINSMILGSNYFCCLCFKTVADSAIHIEDKVILQRHGGTSDEIFMSDLLSCILGQEVCNQLTIFNAVCNQCSSAAISSYKFISKCQENSQRLCNILDGLIKGTEICLSNAKDSKAGYVSINTETFEYNGYNSKKTAHLRFIAYQRFLGLQNIQKNQSKIKILSNTGSKCSTAASSTKECDIIKDIIQRTLKKRDKILQVKLVRLPSKIWKQKKAFICPGCDKTFCQRSSMLRHYDKVKHIPRNIQCTECMAVFTTEFEWRKHKHNSHVLNWKPSNIASESFLEIKEEEATRKVPIILKHSFKKKNCI